MRSYSMRALPTDRKVLSTVMQRMADNHLTDLILTTGGAGCGPMDCTPEATMDVVERPLLGIPEAMRAHTMKLTKRSMLNRAAAGIRQDVLIVNLPARPGGKRKPQISASRTGTCCECDQGRGIKMKITYLEHSGFTIEHEDVVMIF